MNPKNVKQAAKTRRQFAEALKSDAVQMHVDGHSASSIAERLELPDTDILYRKQREQLNKSYPIVAALNAQVVQLEAELHRVKLERDIVKTALVILNQRK